MEKFMKICEDSLCTGCLACVDACKKNAISVKKDFQGFSYPLINNDVCVHCNTCISVCPVNKQKKNKMASFPYACWDENKQERKAATSGGVFTCLAKNIISNGGVVYGAVYDFDMRVIHERICSLDEANRSRGSKYVQSDTLHIYKKVENDIKKGMKVLFSGTPCQIAALKNYLGKEYDNLLLIDIMCHGVSSPLVYDDYLEWLEEKKKSKLCGLNFRYKKPGWSVFSIKADFCNASPYISSKFEDPYLIFFLSDLILRRSCFKCKFASPERVGDITLADFWQYRAKKIKDKSENGVNLVLINTKKGVQYFENIENEIYKEKHSWEEAYTSNLQFTKPVNIPKEYDEFWSIYNQKGFREVLKNFWKPSKKMKYKLSLIAWKRTHEYLFIKKISRKCFEEKDKSTKL